MANLVPLSKSSLVKQKKSAIVKADKFLPAKSKSTSLVKIPKNKSSENSENILVSIERKVIKIDKLLKNSLLLSQKESEGKRKKQEQEEFSGREKELEKKKAPPIKGIKLPSLPKMGFLDWIKNFITQTILGFLFIKFYDFLPQLLRLLPVILKVGDFLIDIGGKLLDGLITFVDWGYKAYDATRGFVKNIFGEDGAKKFDELSGLLNKFMNLAILAGMVTAFGGKGGPSGGGKGSGGGRGGRPKPRVTRSGGAPVGGPDIRNPFRQKPRVTRSGGGSPGVPDIRSPFRQRPKITTGGGGAVGSKGILSTVRPFLKRIPLPVVGALIDFGLSVALGENPGRAAFRAIGAGLLGAVGTVVGSVVPFAGNIIGGIIGGTAGDMAGGALYDMFFSGTKPKQGKTNKLAGGGQPVTRGGQTSGGPAKRTLKKKKSTRSISFAPRKIKPGKNAGGEEKVRQVFPNPEKAWWDPFGLFSKKTEQPKPEEKPKGKTANSQEFLIRSNDELGRSDYFGPFFTLAIKSVLGEKPDILDYKNAGRGLNSWIQSTFNTGQLAYAGGGEVDAKQFFEGEDYTDVIAKSVEDSVSKRVDATIRDLKNELSLRRPVGREEMIQETLEKYKTDPSLDVGPGGTVTGGNADFWTLVAIASLESGNPQGRADVAQSIYNRLASGVYSGKTLKELIVSGNGRQYQPVGRAVREFRSISDKMSAINAIMVANKLNKAQAEKFINDTASAIQNKDLQKSAAEFVGGRTDFWAQGLTPPTDGIGYTVRHGHRFGWFVGPSAIAYGRKNPGPAKAPQLGDIIVMGGGTNISLGKGYGSAGSKIAGELGRYVKKLGVVPGSIHEHPEFGGVKGRHASNSYHYQGRAIDLGAYAYEQGPILKAIADFNKMKGVKPVELLKAGDPGHSDHVHVAYEKGGITESGSHIAKLGEKGREFVIDADSTKAIQTTFPGFLDALNKAKYDDAIQVLRNFVSYEQPYAEPEVHFIEVPVEVPVPIPTGGGGGYFGGGGSIDNKIPGQETLVML